MFKLQKPTSVYLDGVLKRQTAFGLSYSQIGITAEGLLPNSGFHVHKAEIELGSGQQLFEQAIVAIRQWKHFSIRGILLWPPRPPIENGADLIVCARHTPLWSINPCRIVYTLDDTICDTRRFGYGYGTLPEHSERGEERFLLEWCAGTDIVRFAILAFSRYNGLLVHSLWPLAKQKQDRFRLASVRALRKQLSSKYCQ